MLHFIAFAYLQWAALFTKIGWVDILASVLLLWGLLMGMKRGLESELPKFLEIAVATIVTLNYYSSIAKALNSNFSAPQYPAELLSFAGIAFFCILAVRLLFKIVSTVVSLKFMATISHVGGAVVGAVRYILLFSLLSYFFVMLPFDFFKSSYTFERSLSGPFFLQTSPKFYRYVTYYMPFRLETPETLKKG